MTAQEFVEYMPASALAETIIHVTETTEPSETAQRVLVVCFAQLVALVGDREAVEMVSYQDLSEVVS